MQYFAIWVHPSISLPFLSFPFRPSAIPYTPCSPSLNYLGLGSSPNSGEGARDHCTLPSGSGQIVTVVVTSPSGNADMGSKAMELSLLNLSWWIAVCA